MWGMKSSRHMVALKMSLATLHMIEIKTCFLLGNLMQVHLICNISTVKNSVIVCQERALNIWIDNYAWNTLKSYLQRQ